MDNAGKTSILKSLAKENIKTVTPTKGFNVKIVCVENIRFSIWDLGGQMAIRNVWENYYKGNNAIVNKKYKIFLKKIFVIDSSDQYRLNESGNELREILEVKNNKLYLFKRKMNY